MRRAESSIEHIVLTYDTAYQASVRVGPEYAERFKNNKIIANEREDPCSYGELVRTVMVMVLGLSAPQTVTYKTPASWWQMLKRDYAPKWFKSKFPVRENIDVVEIKDIFPFPKEKFPDSVGTCVRITTLKNYPWRTE